MEPFKYDARIYGKYLKLERVVRNQPRERLRRGGQLEQDPPVTGVRVRQSGHPSSPARLAPSASPPPLPSPSSSSTAATAASHSPPLDLRSLTKFTFLTHLNLHTQLRHISDRSSLHFPGRTRALTLTITHPIYTHTHGFSSTHQRYKDRSCV
jgi:hypothetical protein